MQINNFNVAPTLTAGTNNSNNNGNFGAGAAEGGFAALLRQQSQAASSILLPAPAPAPVPSPSPSPSPSPAPDCVPNTRALKTGNPARTPDKSSPAKASQASSTSANDLSADKIRKAETTQEGDEAGAPSPPLIQQVADLRLPVEPAPTALHTARPPATEAGAVDPATAADAPGKSAKPRGVENAARIDAAMKADAKLSDKPARDQGARPASLPASDFTAAFAELRPTTSPTAQPAAGTDIAAAAAVAAGGATFNPAPGTTREVALAHVNLPTPVTAPDFVHHLGAQLSVLARDGVQQAELHLNPADMGPVSVHITMDGTQARIDFGADVAATRQVIEAGMPELASALADAGFTLAGGGVSQHPRGRGEGGRGEPASDAGARRVAAGNSDATPASRVIRSTVSVGGVDIYA